MKKTFYIKKSRLYSEVNYSAVLSTCKYNGFNLEYNELEKMNVTSGAVCFFDAYNPDGLTKPFTDVFPKGVCTPFTLSVFTSDGQKIAFAGLKFTDEAAVKWKTALCEEKEVIKLALNDNVVLSINSGLACMGDFIAFRDYMQLLKNENGNFHPLDSFVSFDGHTAEVAHLSGGGTLAVFSSGWGEGAYSCFIGLDANDKITAVICDFGMIERSPKKSGEDETVQFVFDINPEELYQNDPNLSDSENAVAKWTMVIGSGDSPDDAALFNAYSRRGYAYHSTGRYAQALDDYLKAIELGHGLEKSRGFKFHAWTLYDNAGTLSREMGNTESAVKLFLQAKDYGDSFYAGAYNNLIDIYSMQKNFDEAVKIADEMVRDRPHDANAFNKRAKLYVQKEDYLSAINDYEVLIERFKWGDAILEKSACLSMLGRNLEALKFIEEYLTENKANEFYYYNKALIEFRMNRFSKSYQNASNANFVNPDYIPALHLLIELDTLKLNYDSVVKWAGKYIENRPSQIFGYNVRAEGLVKLKNYAAAAEDYEYIVRHISKEAEIFYSLIKCRILSRELSVAKKHIKLLKKKDDAFFLGASGAYLTEKKHYITAEKLLIAAFHRNPYEQYLIDLADLYFKTGRKEKAESYIERAAQLYPASESAVLKAAEFYKKTGEREKLQKQIELYIVRFLNNTDDEVLRKTVEENLKK